MFSFLDSTGEICPPPFLIRVNKTLKSFAGVEKRGKEHSVGAAHRIQSCSATILSYVSVKTIVKNCKFNFFEKYVF